MTSNDPLEGVPTILYRGGHASPWTLTIEQQLGNREIQYQLEIQVEPARPLSYRYIYTYRFWLLSYKDHAPIELIETGTVGPGVRLASAHERVLRAALIKRWIELTELIVPQVTF